MTIASVRDGRYLEQDYSTWGPSHPIFREFITMSVTTSSVFHPSLDDINLLVHANHWNPFSLLGPHEVGSGDSRAWVVRAFLPEARDAWVVDLTQGEPGFRVPMDRIHPDGLFECV